MGNQIIILLVVGSLLGLFGGNAISKLNPFKGSSAKVQVVKNESQREEYFRDKVKGVEYRVNEKNVERNPVSQTLGGKIGSFIDNFFRAIITFLLIGVVIFFMTGLNIFKMIVRMRKALKQLVKGVESAKPKLNGNHGILKDELSKNMDNDSKLLVDEIRKK